MTLAEFRTRHRRLLEYFYALTPASVWGLNQEKLDAALYGSWQKHGGGAGFDEYSKAIKFEDLALATGCSLGLERAWQKFYEQTRVALRAAGRSLAGSRGEELADALFGELYEQRERLASFAGRSSLAGWLRAVLYQNYVDLLRREKKQESLEEREEAGAAEPAAAALRDGAEQAQYERIAQTALNAALGQLPSRQKLLLDFYYFHGLTLREAAALVGVHEATASRELDRARGQLRTTLEEILRREHRLGEKEVRHCLYRAAQGRLEVRAAVQDRGSAAVPK